MHGEIGSMDPIMDSIESTTGKKLELIVASHAHRDHISGFGQFADRFADFKIGAIWMPWTENKDDANADALRRKQLALYDTLDKHIRHGLSGSESNPKYATALDALANLRGNETAILELGRGFGGGAQVRYLEAGVSVAKVGEIEGLSAEILGPPRDDQFLSRMNPPVAQRFLTAPAKETDGVHPFPKFEIYPTGTDPNYNSILTEGQPLVLPSDLDSLHTLADAPAERLVFALDSVRNNTSLVILFRFRGKSLLFPGDAQWGNWQSWIGTDYARQVLSQLDFLKLAHHGSENATPVDVVNALRTAGLAAMVSTQVKPFPTIPRIPLLDAVQTHCEGNVVVRSDWIRFKDASIGPNPTDNLPQGFTTGDIWIDYEL
jgi:hypothetical protein